MAHAEGVADRQDEITHFQRVGITQCKRREFLVRNLDLQHREVGTLVGDQHLGLELALVRERHLDVRGIGNDMVVGDDQSIRIDDDARSERTGNALARTAETAVAPKEAPEERVLGKAVGLLLHQFALRVDVDDGRRRGLHQRREGQLHGSSRAWHGLLVSLGERARQEQHEGGHKGGK